MEVREKMAGCTRNPQMDAERINLIGTKLADLSARTSDLRRYL